MEPNPLCPDLPVFDLQSYLEASDRDTPELQRLCQAMALCLRNTSALVVRDPRVDRLVHMDRPLWPRLDGLLPGLAWQHQ